MRDLILGCVAIAFLLSAFHTVHVRREVYALGHEIGSLEKALQERRRVDENLRLELERLLSPVELAARAEDMNVSVTRPKSRTELAEFTANRTASR